MTTAAALGVGLHPGESFETYRGIDAINASKLLRGLKTAAELREAIEHPDTESTAALEFGKALHVAVLQPDRFGDLVSLGPINPGTKKCYTETSKAWAEFRAETPDSIALIAHDDYEKIQRMRDAIHAHPNARSIVNAAGHRECIQVWNDPETGILCKSRHDLIVPSHIFSDLKSTLDIHWFDNEADKFGYEIRAAMYAEGHYAITGDRLPFFLVVASKEPPYLVDVVEIAPDSDAAIVGRFEYHRLLRVLRQCRDSGEWPGLPTEIRPLQLPAWKRKKYEEMGVLGGASDVESLG